MDRPIGFQQAEVPRFQDNRHMKVVRFSALCTGHLYPPGIISGTHFCYRLSQPQGQSAARRIMSIKNSSDTIRNRTRDLLACSSVPQPIASLCMSKLSRIFKTEYYATEQVLNFSTTFHLPISYIINLSEQ
jgi:hypothetical protein